MSEIPEKLYQKCILCTLVLFPTCLEMKKTNKYSNKTHGLSFLDV